MPYEHHDADLFTKLLSVDRFAKLRLKLNMTSLAQVIDVINTTDEVTTRIRVKC